MNIRTLTNPISSVDAVRTTETKAVKTESGAEDRDADGRRGQQEPNHDPLNDQEFAQAKERLEQITKAKSKGLVIEVEVQGNYRVFLIKDQNGETIRRIIEWELRALLADKDKRTGQIFDKAV